MHDNRFDIAVLGAGIVGISTAIHLQRLGISTVIVDRRGAGAETSYGNAGIIQAEAIHPYLFPRRFVDLIAYALNRRVEAHYRLRDLFRFAPFLFRYWRNSRPAPARRILEANRPLFGACLDAHGELVEAAGCDELIRRNGWLRLFRSSDASAAASSQIAELRSLGMSAQMIGTDEVAALEPDLLSGELHSAAVYRDPWSVKDPGALTRAYAQLFEEEGGAILTGDAAQASRQGGAWHLPTTEGLIRADAIVVALGPWSRDFLLRHGLDLPMAVKRGYHCHYEPAGGACLTRPVVDDENGIVLSPMVRGIRLTTGAEFAALDAPPTPVQLARALPLARQIFPLGKAVDQEPWIGARPVFPDMLPVIGAAPGMAATWLNFGHAHHGFTLGPATGKLLAQMIAGKSPYCDPQPYSAARFAGRRHAHGD